MKSFFAAFFGTIAGLIVTFFLFIIVMAIIIASAVGSSFEKKMFKVKKNSVLHIKLDKEIPERESNNPFTRFDFSSMKETQGPALRDIIESIKNAKTDGAIKGIYLDVSNISAGLAAVEEVRNALKDFKSSRKWIISYSEIYTQRAYYIASIADKIYLNPKGMLELRGIVSGVIFFKGALEKLEIQPQIFKHGKYKSAVEPLTEDKISPANREQIKVYTGSIWNHLLEGISETRKISVNRLNNIADSLAIRTPEDAIKYGLVDELKYKDEILEILKEKLSVKKDDKINTVELAQYVNSPKSKSENDSTGNKLISRKNKIAIVYATGEIKGGEGDDETIGSERISETIRKARKDTTIKAIVLRVNSPGGSALASEIIWREVALAKKEKPVIVSMGDVAASGGYYISCAADAIVAQPNTITGSIGVFGVLMNTKKFLNNKLGITIDTVNTNKHSDFGSAFREVTSEEGMIIQKEIEIIYDTFVNRVAEGRKMTYAQVDSIAQGRVWSGINAKQIGLVDELGGINKAIELAAKKANIENYKIVELPRQKDLLEELAKTLSGEAETKFVKNELGENFIYYQQIKSVTKMNGVQALMPFQIVVE